MRKHLNRKPVPFQKELACVRDHQRRLRRMVTTMYCIGNADPWKFGWRFYLSASPSRALIIAHVSSVEGLREARAFLRERLGRWEEYIDNARVSNGGWITTEYRSAHEPSIVIQLTVMRAEGDRC